MQPITVSGTIDGTNSVFTLSAVPSFLMLWTNGLLQDPSSYAISGALVVFLPGSVLPQPGDDLIAYGDTGFPVCSYLTISGVGPVFTLSAAPLFLEWYRNGQLQQPGVDYTLAGNVVTCLGGAIPQPGDDLIAVSRSTAASSGIAGAVDGLNPAFVLSPSPSGALEWYRNGQLQDPAGQYALVGNVVTCFGAAIPQPGDVLIAVADFSLSLTTVRVILRGVKRTRKGQEGEVCACPELPPVKRAV
jgi:hypothetical protein